MAIIPFDDRDGTIWFDGKLVPWRDAKIHVLTHALHYASCVFEGERVYGGKVFHLDEHSERLINSAKLLGFEIPIDLNAINDATNAVVKANNIVDGYVRPVAWRGAEQMGVAAQQTKIHMAIATWEWPAYFSPEARLKGIRIPLRETDADGPLCAASPGGPCPRTHGRASCSPCRHIAAAKPCDRRSLRRTRAGLPWC